MIHIKANNGDFWIDPGEVLQVTQIHDHVFEYALSSAGVERLHELVIITTVNDITLINSFDELARSRERIIKAVNELWQQQNT